MKDKKLLGALERARKAFDEDKSDGQAFAVLVAVDALRHLGAPDHLTEPLYSVFEVLQNVQLSNGYSGNGPKPK